MYNSANQQFVIAIVNKSGARGMKTHELMTEGVKCRILDICRCVRFLQKQKKIRSMRMAGEKQKTYWTAFWYQRGYLTKQKH